MTLTVEDGSGVTGADTYVDLDDTDQRAIDNNKTNWQTQNAEIREAALKRATSFVDVTYEFLGLRITRDQALRWPRVDVVDDEGYSRASNVIPQELKDAVMELAFEEAENGLLSSTARGGAIKRERTRVEGAVDLETEYFDGASPNREFPMADRLLAPLVTRRSSGFSVALERV